MKAITDLVLEEVRDLSIMYVPTNWVYISNDDHIKSLVAKEMMVTMLTSRSIAETSGQVIDVPPMASPLRDIDITLVRKVEDLDGYVIDHPDCQECVDAVEIIRMSAAEGTMLTPIAAVVQFSFDQITNLISKEVEP